MSGAGAGSPIAVGSFAWCRFPFGPPDPPDRPGPVRHIAYVLADQGRGAGRRLLLAYTSSGPWRGRTAQAPRGVLDFDATAARAVNQRPFHLDLRCLALVPVTEAWFPDLRTATGGVAGTADAALRARIMDEAKRLTERSPEVVEIRGIR